MEFTLQSKCDVSRLTDRKDAATYQGSLPAASCQLIAERFGFEGVSEVVVDLTVKLIAKETWEVKGQISAMVTQACVMTATPIDEQLMIRVEERYVPHIDQDNEQIEIDVSAVDVELLTDQDILLGELVQQAIGLNAAAHPRLENAPEHYQAGPEIKVENPFQKLSELKN